MGIIGSINSVGKAAGKAYNSVKTKYNEKKGLFGTSYRVSVLNDFSIVTKAVFYILGYDYESNVQSFKLLDTLPVQINPEHLYHAAAKKVTRQENISGGGKSMESVDGSNFSTSVEIQVFYDIYDDYLTTGEGLITTDGRGSNISLLDRDYTSLPKLLELGTNPNFRKLGANGRETKVLFKWGEIKHFGIVSGVNAEYTAFSRWGSPLKCNASVTMELEPIPESLIKARVMDEITAYTQQMDFLNTAAMVGQTAVEEYAGVALGAVQSLRSLI